MSVVLQTGAPSFRSMKLSDMDEVLGIETTVYELPWSEGIMQDCIRVGYCCRVMTVNDQIVAYSIMSIGANEAHILNICVHRDWQNQGLGRYMLEHMMDIARKEKTRTLFLEVRCSNTIAIQLYHSAGFNQIGCRKNYYPALDGREHALIFAMDLIE